MNTIELIKSISLKVASESKCNFLLNDIKAVIEKDKMERVVSNGKELVKELEHALINANYTGDYKAGELSFLLQDYLRGYDVLTELKNFK